MLETFDGRGGGGIADVIVLLRERRTCGTRSTGIYVPWYSFIHWSLCVIHVHVMLKLQFSDSVSSIVGPNAYWNSPHCEMLVSVLLPSQVPSAYYF
jgi:hypothetical protein